MHHQRTIPADSLFALAIIDLIRAWPPDPPTATNAIVANRITIGTPPGGSAVG